MSCDNDIRNIAVYILWKLEWNFNYHFEKKWERKKSILIDYKIHFYILDMMKKYSYNKFTIQQGFALLAQVAEGERSTCFELVQNDEIINVLKKELDNIYSTRLDKFERSDLDLLKSTSKFLKLVTEKGECLNMALTSKSIDILNMVFKIFQLIQHQTELQYVPIILCTLQSILYMSDDFNNISINKHLFIKLLQDNGTLLISIFNFVNFKKSFHIRNVALSFIGRAIARNLVSNCIDPQPSMDILVNQKKYDIMKYIKQFIYISDEDSTRPHKVKWQERLILLDIFSLFVKFGVNYYWSILTNDDVMNIIYDAVVSDEKDEWFAGIGIITEILTQPQRMNKEYGYPWNFIRRLLHWKQGLMIEGICRLFGWYNANNCFKMVIVKRMIMEMFTLLKGIVFIIKEEWIKKEYIQHKLNEYELMPSLIRIKFVVYDYLTNDNTLLRVNAKLLTKIIRKYDIDKKTFGSIKDDILYLTRICEEELGFILRK